MDWTEHRFYVFAYIDAGWQIVESTDSIFVAEETEEEYFNLGYSVIIGENISTQLIEQEET